MGAMMLSAICREIFARIDRPETKRNPVHLYVDEFENFSMADFETILAEGRKFGLHLILANQVLAQLNTRMRSMILNNVGFKVVFRTGREDSSILSRDLTGDPKAYDLPTFPVGEALLWTKSQPLVHIEVNEPLIKDVGFADEETKAYIRAVKDQAPPFVGFSQKPTVITHEPKAQHKPAPRASLEDWL